MISRNGGNPWMMRNDTAPAGTRVLLVEDDAELRGLLAGELAAEGFPVDHAGSVAEARRVLSRAPIGVVVLDVQLPDGSGFAVASYLRKQRPATGIIMLSRLSDPAWQVAGLDVGADVYLPKPLDGEVLCAAVRSLARRLAVGPVSQGRVDDASWTLGQEGWQLVAPDGCAIPLGSGERTLLQALCATPGRAISREALLAVLATAAGEPFSSHRLDMLAHRLRRKVEQAGLPPLPLKAIRGQGMVLLQAEACMAPVQAAPARAGATDGA
jgi:DNA-binding response OmpR family regulator